MRIRDLADESATAIVITCNCGANLGLVPRRYQAGQIDYVGSISKVGAAHANPAP